MSTVVKRSLRDPVGDPNRWAEVSPQERLKAVEVINRLGEPEYAKQAFPRIHRITRKSRS